MAITSVKEFIADNQGGTSQIPPFLLNFWQEHVYQDIWHFNQVSGDDVPQLAYTSFVQPERDRLVRSLNSAYRKMSQYAGFTLMPQWFVEDIPLGRGSPLALVPYRTHWGYVQAYGQRTATVIEAGTSITYSKSNAALLENDTATITVTSADATVDEVHVYFQVADGASAAADPNYEIAPLTISKSGNTITITGYRALFVQPSIWAFPYTGPAYQDKNLADTSTAGHFVTAVDVYRVYTDTSVPAQVVSDPIWTQDSGLGTDVTNTATIYPVDDQLGLFKARVELWTNDLGPIHKLRVYYKAGYPANGQRMDDELAQAMVRLANADMPNKPPGFEDRELSFFEFDRMAIPESQERRSNRFGPLMGHQFAWNVVMDRSIKAKGGKVANWRR